MAAATVDALTNSSGRLLEIPFIILKAIENKQLKIVYWR